VRLLALRRTKSIISDQLPKKTDVVVFCQLKPLQRRAYERTLQSPNLKVTCHDVRSRAIIWQLDAELQRP